jgi:hypothetical protein
MESQSLDVIASELQKQRNLVHQKATALRSDLWTVEKDLARIDAALAALSGEAAKGESNGLTEKRPKRTAQSPSAKKADVVATLRQVLERSGDLHEDVLRSEVEAELTKAGFNRSGFAMRFKEALRDSQFVPSSTGLQLASGPDAVVVGATCSDTRTTAVSNGHPVSSTIGRTCTHTEPSSQSPKGDPENERRRTPEAP